MLFIDLDKNLNNGIEKFYIISGTDAFLKSRALDKIYRKLDINYPDINYIKFNSFSSIDEIYNACITLPFIDKYKLIVVYNFNFTSKISEKFKALISDDNPICIIFYYEDESIISKQPLKNNKIFIPDYAVNINCNELNKDVLIKWIKVTCKLQKKNISDSATELLIQYCSNNMTRINSEINKIIDYSEDNITDDVIKNIVIMDENYEIFELSNAIMDKKVDRTMDLLRNMLDRGDEATAIIGLIYNNFRRAFFAVNTNFNDKENSEMLGVKEFAIKKAKEKSRNFGTKKLIQAMNYCMQADMDIKMKQIDKRNRIELMAEQILNL